ncbi:brain protein I3-like [Penaeus japonicus]|uniref:brain protein I3-like n=1 Tax=Penaeus japonicus TaxID=27405 RepID=UPI001C712F6D|nr:brain protein I3-like [Penaeus japonicus]
MSKPMEYAPNQPPVGPPPPYSPHQPEYGFSTPSTTVVMQPQQQHPHQVVTTQPVITTAPVVVVAGATCPACRAGILRNEFTCCGIFLAICFFPIGMLCCFLMMERRCSNCGLTFG